MMKLFPSKTTFRAFSKYFLFGSAVFAVGLVWNFPLEKISRSFTQRLSKETGYQFGMATLKPALPLGFKATKFTVDGLLEEPILFSEMRITVSPLSLALYPFRKGLNVSYAATLDKTVWKGSVDLNPSTLAASLNTGDWRISEIFPLDNLNPMLTGSSLTTEAKVAITSFVQGDSNSLQKGDFSKANGEFHVVSTNVTLDGIPMTTKPLRFDKVEAKGVLKEGKLTIDSISLMGPDITGMANGTIEMSTYFPRSRLQLDAKLTITEKVADLRSMIEGLWNLRIDDGGNVAVKISGPVTPVDRWQVRGY